MLLNCPWSMKKAIVLVIASKFLPLGGHLQAEYSGRLPRYTARAHHPTRQVLQSDSPVVAKITQRKHDFNNIQARVIRFPLRTSTYALTQNQQSKDAEIISSI